MHLASRIPRTQLLWLVGLLVLILSLQPMPLLALWSNNHAMHALSAAAVGNQKASAAADRLIEAQESRSAPHYTYLVYRRALVYDRQGNFSRAQRDYIAALKTQKLSLDDSIYAWFRLGQIARDEGHFDQAMAYFQQTIDMSASGHYRLTQAYAHLFYGELLFETESDLDAFRLHVEQALNLVVDDLTTGRYIRVIYRLMERSAPGDLDTAQEMAEHATAVLPRNTWTSLVRCRVHLKRGELDEAVDWCRRSTELAASNADAHAWLGLALLQDSRPTEALAAFEQAASLRPTEKWYQNLVRRAQAALSQ